MKITELTAYEAMDSRGMPTVAVLLTTRAGCFRALAPAGASVGHYEAPELRDGGERLGGKGVTRAVANVNTTIAARLVGKHFSAIAEVDALLCAMDKETLGANATLAVSCAAARAFAAETGKPLFALFGDAPCLPCPMLNILNGGVHADNNLDIQEFMIIPVGARDFPEAMDMAREVYLRLKQLLKRRGLCTGVGDEGGFTPMLDGDIAALELLCAAIGELQVVLALDIAANEWHRDGVYRLPKRNVAYTRAELAKYYRALIRQFPIVSIEDPFAEDDREGFLMLRQGVQIVGDDLFATNPARIERFADCATALLVKPNQIGTVSEALCAMDCARKRGLSCILSHRSGDTEDAFLADFAVGTGCGWLKCGAPARGERTAKYNRLAEIAHLFPDLPYSCRKKRLFSFFR